MSGRKNNLPEKAEPLPMPPHCDDKKELFRDESFLYTNNSHATLPLRPHHLLCTEFFRGYGYSDDFTANMSAVITELNSGDPTVRLSADTDIVCRKCPHNKNGRCDTYEKVLRYDLTALDILGLRESHTAHWSELKKSAREKIISAGKLNEVCGDCQWFNICGK